MKVREGWQVLGRAPVALGFLRQPMPWVSLSVQISLTRSSQSIAIIFCLKSRMLLKGRTFGATENRGLRFSSDIYQGRDH